jgi:hypothetical protein
MREGFLGFHASFMLDFVVCALVLVVPVLAYSIRLARDQRRYALHRNIQIGLGAVLLATVAAFEIDLQLVHGGWRNVVAQRRPPLTSDELEFAHQLLRVHLVFAVSTPFLWLTTMILALRRFPNPPVPGAHSKLHKTLGWLSATDIALTSATGLAWYYFAFVR